MHRGGFVYIMSSFNHSTLYTGVTSNLIARVFEHKTNYFPKSFTAKYNCHKLVYFYFFETIEEAIVEEKRIKAGSRQQKEDLIQSINPKKKDLWEEIKEW